MSKRSWISDLKLERGCDACGYRACAAVLSFHHRNPEEKLFPVANIGGRSSASISMEIEKCDLLCSNCHGEIEDEIRKSGIRIRRRQIERAQLRLSFK